MSQNNLLKFHLSIAAIMLFMLVACAPQESQTISTAQPIATGSTESELTTSQLVSPTTTIQSDQIGLPTRLTSTPIASPTLIRSTDTAMLPPTPSITPSPTMTSTPLLPLELYIIYSTTSESNGIKNSQVWLFDTLLQEKQLLFSTAPGSTIELNDVRWHPLDRSLIYYIQRETDRKWALWRFDRDQAQADRITEFFSEDTVGWLADWSIDGQWLSLYAEDYSEGTIQVFSLLVDSETGRVVTNEQLGEWSPVIPNQFVYYDSLTANPARLLIKSTDSFEPIQSLDLDFTPVVLSWQPSGENLIVTSDSGVSGSSEMYSYDFTEGGWIALQEPERNIYSPMLSWAPSSMWLAISYSSHIYILSQTQLTEKPVLLAEMERPVVETWLEQPDRMLVRSNNTLWLLDPSMPNKMRQVISLQILGLDSTSSIDIWEP
jgi:hypothetical protein